MRSVAVTACALTLTCVASSVALATPATSRRLQATSQQEAALKSVFTHYKIATHEMKATDKIKWSGVLSAKPVGPLLAYDATDHRYWAIANFTLIAPFSNEAAVSFQDGGSMGVMYKTPTGHWTMKSLGEFPPCPSLVPSVVAHLWKLPSPPACS